MPPTDSVFLLAESRQTPMHVGGLQLFRPPADFPGTRELFQRLVSGTEVAPLFRKRPRRTVTSAGQWAWVDDTEFDIEHHVRHNALPAPSRVLELLSLCSRLHGTPLDRRRPLWEFHLIEGLVDGRFAIYFKIHHSLVDGVAAQRLLQSVLTDDPDARELPAPWTVQPHRAASRPDDEQPRDLWAPLRGALKLATDAAGLPAALTSTLRRSLNEQSSPVSFGAPRTMFNVPITGARRFAAQSWPLARIRAVSGPAEATVNDVVLAMCSGALRRYLSGLGALPDQPLIAMVPVALESRRDAGNAVGAVMCNLATQLADPADRLATIRTSMIGGKQALAEMTPLQIVALTGLGMSPLVLQGVPGYAELFRPPFNVIISNVPGPRRPLYLDGARLDGLYPLSIPYHGQALNITCTSYGDELAFGLTGCRRTVPHLQYLLGFLDDELADLERAVGLGSNA